MTRPKLNPYSATKAIQELLRCKPGMFITLSPGQWDTLLDEAYFRQNATLIEIATVNGKQAVIGAYKYDNSPTSK